eukprot:TRINITY_DN94864_c0_g1_i1.p1 TRINITY_DN94864_c0_g1~~TRINITY_DN94864_c0_g1_i1.p1  ORF type:complete len:215 (-),score=33.56 TRINITY_DN94864_c0_g1_i1:32-601(-)
MATVEGKMNALDQELASLKSQIAKSRPGSTKESLKRRAIMLLKQRKQYEKQRDAMFSQQMNLDTTAFMHESVKSTADQVKAMKASTAELKKAFKELDIDEVEDMHFDMEDLMYDHEEIQEVMSRQLGVPDTLDEDELLGELDDMFEETETLDEVPNYLVNAATASKNAEREGTSVVTDSTHAPVHNVEI